MRGQCGVGGTLDVGWGGGAQSEMHVAKGGRFQSMSVGIAYSEVREMSRVQGGWADHGC